LALRLRDRVAVLERAERRNQPPAAATSATLWSNRRTVVEERRIDQQWLDIAIENDRIRR
jgi:hypothetical protein